MKSVLVYASLAIGTSAAALQKRIDPGCPDLMPTQASLPWIFLCTAYDLSYENACDRDGRTDRGYRTCESIGPLAS
ncbi:hypothetical protein P171DRAFT_487208 [Karstenula rhodostoma CBS 690.94]|uniref:Kazal-like domain-containing protein n=1 Tax=Karstenula rhodostoma CBS 690.94 TaxID=1392251 RepID=A0A9P4UBL8_9PLEO|nr:hypothetical protein P171DRAFT_487208 [Karstenula rhodostoma CBS 690.94]